MVNDDIPTIEGSFKDFGVTKVDRKALPVNSLCVDQGYQRRIHTKLARDISRNFIYPLCGELLVSYRDGKYWIIDGNHRKNGLIENRFKNCRCAILHGLTADKEAELFELMNIRRASVTSVEVFKSRLYRQEPMAVEINACVEACEFELVVDRSSVCTGRQIRAVNKVEKIYRMGGFDGLSQVLNVIKAAWDEDEEKATDGLLLEALHYFLTFNLWKDKINIKTLVQKLSKIPATKVTKPARLYRDGSPKTVVAAQIAKIYNNGIKGRAKLRISDLHFYEEESET